MFRTGISDYKKDFFDAQKSKEEPKKKGRPFKKKV
jgi:hypothetical protein